MHGNPTGGGTPHSVGKYFPAAQSGAHGEPRPANTIRGTVFSRYRVHLPPATTDPSAPSFEAAVEEYVRRIRDVYEVRATENRRYYRLSGIAVIIAGASLPLLTTLD
jgi:hypothetical protein